MTVARLNRSILLTPPGVGAIGVIRVVGPDAIVILGKLFRSASRGFQPASAFGGSAQVVSCSSFFTGDRLRYGRLIANDEVVDDVLVSQVPTAGSPAYDISAHGSIRVIERILQVLEHHGAPLGDAEEAPMPNGVGDELNRKVGWVMTHPTVDSPVWPTRSIIEQEAIEALSGAKTQRAVRFLAWQRQHLMAALEGVASLCSRAPDRASSALEAMLTGYKVARTLMDGVTVVILGPPNSGKSTLFNRLLGRDAMIVSPKEGTTRDWVAESVEIDGVPFTLVDTAGRHETFEQLERLAMESGWALGAKADLCLLLLDGSQPLSKDARKLCGLFNLEQRRAVTVVNKIDLGRVWNTKDLSPEPADGGHDPVRVSAQTGSGLDRLTQSLLRRLGYEGWVDRAPCFFTPRQRDLATQTLSDLVCSPVDARRAIREQLIGAEVVGGFTGVE